MTHLRVVCTDQLGVTSRGAHPASANAERHSTTLGLLVVQGRPVNQQPGPVRGDRRSGTSCLSPAHQIALLVTFHPGGMVEMPRIAESPVTESDPKIRSMRGTSDFKEDAAAPEAPGQSIVRGKKRHPLLIRSLFLVISWKGD